MPEDILALSAVGRLEAILEEGRIRATRPFSPAPVVCFSEATNAGLDHLIGGLGYQPWGIIFDRQLVYDVGGGPVFHYRSEEWEGHREALPAALRARFVRFDAGESEWLWEREWRIVVDEEQPGFEFTPEDVAAIVVGDPDWSPAVLGVEVDWEGNPDLAQVRPDWLPDCGRWWWNPRTSRLEVLSDL